MSTNPTQGKRLVGRGGGGKKTYKKVLFKKDPPKTKPRGVGKKPPPEMKDKTNELPHANGFPDQRNAGDTYPDHTSTLGKRKKKKRKKKKKKKKLHYRGKSVCWGTTQWKKLAQNTQGKAWGGRINWGGG